jgi:hypothetical protein
MFIKDSTPVDAINLDWEELISALSFAQPRIAQPRLSCSFLLLAYDILRQPSLLLAYRIVHPSLASGVG